MVAFVGERGLRPGEDHLSRFPRTPPGRSGARSAPRWRKGTRVPEVPALRVRATGRADFTIPSFGQTS